MVNIFWGVILIAVGGLLLAERMDWIAFRLFSAQGWMLAFAVASAVFFFSYFLNGVRHWGWLFPALISAALSLTIWMGEADIDNSIMGVPILAAIAIPFYVGYFVERKNWGLLIPAWIMTIAAAVTLLAEQTEGAWIGALFLFAAAAPFLVVYLTNRSRRWALIPAAILAVIGTFPLLDLFFQGDLVGVFVMLLFAAPFIYLYFRWKEAWWAMIPAGIFTSIALVVLLSLIFQENDALLERIGPGVLFLGFAASFGILWLRRTTLPTDWARYPAAGLLAASVLGFALGETFQEYWPAVFLLVAGILILVNTLVRKKEPKGSIPTDSPQ
jgi:hypothetical protein